MQSKHVEETFLLLTQIRSSPGAFADLPRSISDAAEFYRAEEELGLVKRQLEENKGKQYPI